MRTLKQKHQLRPCCECARRRERCRPVVLYFTGLVDYVCPQCWHRFGYEEYVLGAHARSSP